MSREITGRERAERRGRRAESLACAWLRARGWRVVERNLRTPHSEVDALAVRGGVCALVEVKARASWAACEDALDWNTRRRLDRAAAWLAERSRWARNRELRIDAVLVVGWRVRHVPDAWRDGD